MSDPLVSICLPTRNRAPALRKSLANIRAQEYRSLEIIISDNCSDDDTEAVCRELAAADGRIRYVRQPHNIGLHGNHNFCMDQARGEFLCIFHDHDERDPRMVGTMVAFMGAHPRVGLVSSDWDLVDDEDRSLGLRPYDGPEVTPGLEYITRTIRSGRSSVGTPGAMVRREALGDARFGLDAPIGFGDFPIWFQVAERWDIGHIHQRLWSWRQNRVSHSARPIQSIAHDYEINVGGYCDAHLARWPDHARQVAAWRRSMTRYLFWALAYEIGLHFRKRGADAVARRDPQTLFEIMDYTLTSEQFAHALAHMKACRTGADTRLAYAVVSGLVRLGVTAPLGWAVSRQAAVRTLLGLK